MNGDPGTLAAVIQEVDKSLRGDLTPGEAVQTTWAQEAAEGGCFTLSLAPFLTLASSFLSETVPVSLHKKCSFYLK